MVTLTYAPPDDPSVPGDEPDLPFVTALYLCVTEPFDVESATWTITTTTPGEDLDAASKSAFAAALELLREQGLDPEDVLRRAGRVISYYHDHPAEWTGEMMEDEV